MIRILSKNMMKTGISSSKMQWIQNSYNSLLSVRPISENTQRKQFICYLDSTVTVAKCRSVGFETYHNNNHFMNIRCPSEFLVI